MGGKQPGLGNWHSHPNAIGSRHLYHFSGGQHRVKQRIFIDSVNWEDLGRDGFRHSWIQALGKVIWLPISGLFPWLCWLYSHETWSTWQGRRPPRASSLYLCGFCSKRERKTPLSQKLPIKSQGILWLTLSGSYAHLWTEHAARGREYSGCLKWHVPPCGGEAHSDWQPTRARESGGGVAL